VDAELRPDGVGMAKAFADAYHSVEWTAVYVSPKKRTVTTAQPLCDALGLKMELRPGLEEIHYGKWEDKTVDFVKQKLLGRLHSLAGRTCLEPADWR